MHFKVDIAGSITAPTGTLVKCVLVELVEIIYEDFQAFRFAVSKDNWIDMQNNQAVPTLDMSDIQTPLHRPNLR